MVARNGQSQLPEALNSDDSNQLQYIFSLLEDNLSQYYSKLNDLYFIVTWRARTIIVCLNYKTIDIFRYASGTRDGKISVSKDKANMINTLSNHITSWLDLA